MKKKFAVITGPMFAGKSTKLIEIADRVRERGGFPLFAKPQLDTRYSDNHVVTHDGDCVESSSIKDFEDLEAFFYFAMKHDRPWVFIDEAQFLGANCEHVVEHFLHYHHLPIVLAGLDLDWRGNAFGHMALWSSQATHLIRKKGTCEFCFAPSVRTIRRTKDHEQVMLGGENEYTAGCFDCWSAVMVTRGLV